MGTRLISYVYDAWGGVSYTYENGGEETSAYYNAMLYRGYYYDSDLGLYYLQSRYYDPNTYRFINADGYVSTGTGILGYNMFAYCNNNPVMFIDPTGEWPQWLLDVLDVFKAIYESMEGSLSLGYGIGFSSSATLYSIPVGIELIASETDKVSVDDGLTSLGHESSAGASVFLAVFSLGHTVSYEHSYSDPLCTCDIFESSILEKSRCPANQFKQSDDFEIGLSFGGFLGGGFKVELSFNVSEFVDRLTVIFSK